jgi:sterol desaturase/sphingolipid hydroxylase (fatty acid hydroxylase superfamily)
MYIFESQVEKLQQVGAMLLSPGSILSIPQLVVAFGMAFSFLAVRQRQRRGAARPRAILRAMLSPRFVLHRSVYADAIYYLINTFAVGGLIGWGFFSGGEMTQFITASVSRILGPAAPSGAPMWELRVGITIVAFLSYEFGYYVDHYLKHKIPALWELHKTHHTAEVLNPLTLFRVHPLDTLIFVDIVAMSGALFHGVYNYAIGQRVDTYTIAATNVIMVTFFFLIAHLQHSQFWIPLTGLPGRILLSPAHHQIHHSADPAHFNRNLGSFLAIFDWMFGTLHVPSRESPRLKFGAGEIGEDPHSVTSLLIDPVFNSMKALGLRPPSPRETPAEPSRTPSSPLA